MFSCPRFLENQLTATRLALIQKISQAKLAKRIYNLQICQRAAFTVQSYYSSNFDQFCKYETRYEVIIYVVLKYVC